MISSAYKYVIATICVTCFCFAFYEVLSWLWAKRLEWSGETTYTLANEMNENTDTIFESTLSAVLVKLKANNKEASEKIK